MYIQYVLFSVESITAVRKNSTEPPHQFHNLIVHEIRQMPVQRGIIRAQNCHLPLQLVLTEDAVLQKWYSRR